MQPLTGEQGNACKHVMSLSNDNENNDDLKMCIQYLQQYVHPNLIYDMVSIKWHSYSCVLIQVICSILLCNTFTGEEEVINLDKPLESTSYDKSCFFHRVDFRYGRHILQIDISIHFRSASFNESCISSNVPIQLAQFKVTHIHIQKEFGKIDQKNTVTYCKCILILCSNSTVCITCRKSTQNVTTISGVTGKSAGGICYA